MTTITLPESPESDLLRGAPSDEPCGRPAHENIVRRFLGNIGRRVQLLWTTRVVEGILLKRRIERLYLVMGGHIYFQTLSAAVRLDLFGLLNRHGPLTCTEIARHLEIAEKPARILLLGCTALGLLRKSGAVYSNSLMANRVLLRDVPESIVSIIEWQHHINYRPMHAFYEALSANKNVGLDEFEGDESTLYERLAHYPRLEKIFQAAMQCISVQANKTLVRFVDFSRVRHLVDVGGGDGTNVTALALEYPHLRATVFDSPSVCRIAEENIRQAGLADRVNTVAGNCFEDPFPEEADCFLFSHFLTIWSEEENCRLLKKAFDALSSGGRVIVFNMMQSNSGTGPLSAAMGSPYFLTLATGKGMLYTWKEYESWMKQAGFSSVKKQTLPRDHGAIVGMKS